MSAEKVHRWGVLFWCIFAIPVTVLTTYSGWTAGMTLALAWSATYFVLRFW